MAITYNAAISIGRVQLYDASADTYSVRDTTTGDYFADDVAAGDILYFGKADAIWRDINLTVGTARNGTVEVVWEAYKDSSWSDVTSLVVDDSDTFANTGSQVIHVHIDRLWQWCAVEVNGYTGLWLRCRVASVSGVTEGGANATNAITVGNHTITINADTGVTMNSLYAADVAGGWGAIKAAQDYTSTHHMSFATSAKISLTNGATLVDPGQDGEYGVGKTLEFYTPWWAGEVAHTGLFADSSTSVNLGYYNSATGLSNPFSIVFARSPYAIGGKASISLDGAVDFAGVHIALNADASFNVSKADAVELRDSDLGHWATFANGMAITGCTWWVYGQAYMTLRNEEYIDGAVIGMEYAGVNIGVQTTGARGGYRNCTFNGLSNSAFNFAGNGILEFINCTFNNVSMGTPVTIYRSQYYNLTVVDSDSTAIDGAAVVLKDQTDAEVFSETTDEAGMIEEQVVPYYINVAGTETNRTFVLEISKDGYLPHIKTISNAEMQVGLREKVVLAKAMGYGAFN
ncbi:MAG: hypothetical protein WCP21_04105 [Armatimonadota bacterium]